MVVGVTIVSLTGAMAFIWAGGYSRQAVIITISSDGAKKVFDPVERVFVVPFFAQCREEVVHFERKQDTVDLHVKVKNLLVINLRQKESTSAYNYIDIRDMRHT
jgi:hypothetical protein